MAFFTLSALGLGGLGLLIFGSHLIVRALIALALLLKVKPLFLSIVVLGFVTSAPEWFVTFSAAWKGVPDAALGNIAGSNIINILLILGLTGLFYLHKPDRQIICFDLPCLLAACLVFGGLALDSRLGFLDGLLLLTGFALYLFFVFRQKEREPDSKAGGEFSSSLGRFAALRDLTVGFIALFAGSSLAVDSAADLGRLLGLSERFIGVFILSVGTSLPELAAGFQAILKKQGEIALGNVAGSNIFNTLFVAGSASLLAPLNFSPGLFFDFAFMLGLTAALWGILAFFKSLPKPACLLFAVIYGLYAAFFH